MVGVIRLDLHRYSTRFCRLLVDLCRDFWLVSTGIQTTIEVQLQWDDRRIVWAVREPFRSRHSGAELVAGTLVEGEELIVGSQTPTGGIIFSDGVEADFIEFNSGTIARFSISQQRARLVVA